MARKEWKRRKSSGGGREGIKGYLLDVSDRKVGEKKISTNIGVLLSLGEKYRFVLEE